MTTLRKVLPLFLLLPLLLFPQGNQNNVQLGLIDASASAWKFPTRLFAALPAAASSTGQRFTVTDCLTNTCAAGSGIVRQDMVSTGIAWVPALAYVTSVGWTGGLVTVATGTTTPAFTVAGTSGGIPYFSSASTWASSGALTQYFAILGGGAGNSPTVSTIKEDATAVTITQNSVIPFTSVTAGAVANTLYLNAGKVGFGTTSPGQRVTSQTDAAALTFPIQIVNMADDTTATAAGILFSTGTSSSARGKGAIAYVNDGTGYNHGDIVFLQNSASDTSVAVLSNAVMTVKNAGNVVIYNQTASTGSTLLTITPGAAQTSASTVLSVGAVASVIGLTFNGHACSLVANVMTCP